MKIELYIDGEMKIFTTPVIPLRAKRLYFKIQAESEEKAKAQGENYIPSYKEQMDEEDEMVGILANVVFGGQFTVDQLYDGASNDYVYGKLREAVFGPSKVNNDGDEGNEKGK